MPFRLLPTLLLALAALSAQAQDFPIAGKGIRIIVPFPPGGQTDIQARAISLKLAERLKQPVVVDNRPGASTILGTMELIKAPPDGHTLLFGISNTYSQNPHLFSRLPYDPLRDLTPVMLAARSSAVLVARPDAPFNTVQELVEYARRHPGKLNFASYSAGSTSHLAGELLKHKTGVDLVHVPFRGSADANAALFGGHVDMLFDGPSTAIANAQAGKVKLIAYGDEKRLDVLPGLATVQEQGVRDFSVAGGMQFFGPGGMRKEVAGQVNATLAAVMQEPDIVRLFAEGGNEVVATSAEEHARLAREWYDRWGAVIRTLGLKLD